MDSEFKLVVAGGPDFEDYDIVRQVLGRIHAKRTITELVSGGCSGAGGVLCS